MLKQMIFNVTKSIKSASTNSKSQAKEESKTSDWNKKVFNGILATKELTKEELLNKKRSRKNLPQNSLFL
jgi:hypothetical protein